MNVPGTPLLPLLMLVCAGPRPSDARPGFLVAAPDRGFLGNEEMRDVVAGFGRDRNATLLVVPGDLRRADVEGALERLREGGATRVVVLPFFLSRAEERFRRLRALLEEVRWPVPIATTQPFGESHLAVEALSDRLRALPDRRGRRVLVAGYGGLGGSGRHAVARDLERMAAAAAEGLGLESIRVVTWPEPAQGLVGAPDAEAEREQAVALAGAPRPVLLPWHLGPRLDTMMSFEAERAAARGGAELSGGDVTAHPAAGLWMAREAERHTPFRPEEVGVVVLAHGADHRWNEEMRRACSALAARRKVEFAFCMADLPVMERAVRRLEERGARAIVIVRVFGLAASFRGTVERWIGREVETGAAIAVDQHHGHGHCAAGPPRRLRSSAPVATVGGLEDSPLFAEALLDRALALSKDPARETVILAAHGSGDDAQNEHWRDLLASLARQMRAGRGAAFRALRWGTWREDWPGKREPEIASLREMVREAARDGGRAIVLPARTTSVGPEREYLDGLDYVLGTGFAPHPLFERWLEDQVAAGEALLTGGSDPSSDPPPR